MKKSLLTGAVKDGQLKWDDINAVLIALQTYESKRVKVSIERDSKKRSYLQNSYYWGIPVEMIYATFRGFGEEYQRGEIHEMLKAKFLSRDIIDKRSGEVIGSYARSSAELSTIEFMDYVKAIQRWFVKKFGINIPDPNEELIEYEND